MIKEKRLQGSAAKERPVLASVMKLRVCDKQGISSLRNARKEKEMTRMWKKEKLK